MVKHASRTIVGMLSESDSLAIVAFSEKARVLLPLTKMTERNKTIANEKIECLEPRYSTNLYDGLHTALELIRGQQDSSALSNANVMLLTDGLPNVSPPRGELETLQRYLDTYPEQRAVKISTFGFGYSLKSRLLSDIAREGGSMYAFIPDSSFVGTIFINSVSNLLSVAATRGATLRVAANDGLQILDCASGQKFTKTSWGMNVHIPSILYGQSIDVLLRFASPPREGSNPITATVQMSNLGQTLEAQTTTISSTDPRSIILKTAAVRSSIIEFINTTEKDAVPESRRNLSPCQDLLREVKSRVNSLCRGVSSSSTPEMIDMQKDLDGQITEAYSTSAYYHKWGAHYVLSLAGAHSLQQCINFKDPGIQHYATGKFKITRDAAESIFLKLRPPRPSRRARAPVQSMSAYYSSSAPCFAAGNVELISGQVVSITQVRPGHTVKTSSGFAKVRCIVETPCQNGIENLVDLGDGVLVTPWHPVCLAKKDEQWAFPCSLAEPRPRPCQSVYSFVLDDNAVSMRIGPYDGIALGHGVKGDCVLEHDYLGTERVISDLSRMNGWSEGHVRLATNPAIRDESTGRIVGFRPAPQEIVANKSSPHTFPQSVSPTRFMTSFV